MTNGDSIFTQTKVEKLPLTRDNTHRYLKGNLNTQLQLNKTNSKPQKKINTTPQPQPKVVPLRPVIPKPSSNPPLPINNNSITSLKPKISTITTPNVIVLD